MGTDGLFYVIAKKIKTGFIRIKNALTKFFSSALVFMKRALEAVEEKTNRTILGAAHFLRKVGNRYQQRTKNYYIDEEMGRWHEVIVEKEISADDVPAEYKTMPDEFEVDDTREIDNAIAI